MEITDAMIEAGSAALANEMGTLKTGPGFRITNAVQLVYQAMAEVAPKAKRDIVILKLDATDFRAAVKEMSEKIEAFTTALESASESE